MLILYSLGVPLPMTWGYIDAISKKVMVVMVAVFLGFSDFFSGQRHC